MAISYSEAATTTEGPALDDQSREITLGMTPEMALGLGALSELMDAPVDRVLSQAVRLLMVAINAQDHGQRICLVDDGGKIISEVVDFDTADEMVGVSPFIESDPEHLEP